MFKFESLKMQIRSSVHRDRLVNDDLPHRADLTSISFQNLNVKIFKGYFLLPLPLFFSWSDYPEKMLLVSDQEGICLATMVLGTQWQTKTERFLYSVLD